MTSSLEVKEITNRGFDTKVEYDVIYASGTSKNHSTIVLYRLSYGLVRECKFMCTCRWSELRAVSLVEVW